MMGPHEHIKNPTADMAIGSIMKEQKAEDAANRKRCKEIRNRQRVYICSPYQGDVIENVRDAVRYCCYAIEKKRIPVASHLMYPAILNDKVAEERELGLLFGLSLLEVCEEIWVFGSTVSEGMKEEIAEAKRLGKPVIRIAKETAYGVK